MKKYILLAGLVAMLIVVFVLLNGLKKYLKEHEHETVEKNMKEINSFITVIIGFLVSIIAFLSALFTMI
ncbi:MAG: hypothetical protein PUB89_03725 [Oscillospiraceae bacterium]|nr:hypothetical protein [Oscillospiraceae bacterium]